MSLPHNSNTILTDEAFLMAFEDTSLPAELFTHENHVRLAWLYLAKLSFKEANSKICQSIKTYAASKGAAEKYHETLTQAFIYIISERIKPAQSWDEFKQQHSDLFQQPKELIQQYYSPAIINALPAKQKFVSPDRKSFTLK